MIRILNRLTFVAIATVLTGQSFAAETPQSKGETGQHSISKRFSAKMMMGTFESYSSFFHATCGPALHIVDPMVNRTNLYNPFPEYYEPTFREQLDMIAYSTSSCWRYDSENNGWIFAKPKQPEPYTMTLGDGWLIYDGGYCVSYIPPNNNAEFRIYVAGFYSCENPEKEQPLLEKVRDSLAQEWGDYLFPEEKEKAFKKTTIGQHEALTYSSSNHSEHTSHLWVIADKGCGIVITCQCTPDAEKEVFPDIKAMLKTFSIGNPDLDALRTMRQTSPTTQSSSTPLKAPQELLKTRLSTAMLQLNLFQHYKEYLDSVYNIKLIIDDEELKDSRLGNRFPPFYKPTLKELLDSLAQETDSQWHYDKKRSGWVFQKPGKPSPVSIDLADGWTSRIDGCMTMIEPPQGNMQFGIIAMGSYSAPTTEEETELFRKVRDYLARHWAIGMNAMDPLKKSTDAKVGSHDALYLTMNLPYNGLVYRQWILVEGGQGYAIIMQCTPEDDQVLFPDVEKMLKTVRISDPNRKEQSKKQKTPQNE